MNIWLTLFPVLGLLGTASNEIRLPAVFATLLVATFGTTIVSLL